MNIRKPLWNTETREVPEESVFFIAGEPAMLRFDAEKILRITDVSGETVYRPGVDYLHETNSGEVRRLPGSSMPATPREDLLVAPEKAISFPDPAANAIGEGPDGKLLLFREGDFFAKLECFVSYVAAEGTVFPSFPVMGKEKLPRFRAGGKLRVAFVGDSITNGSNASGKVGFPPYAPRYADQVVQSLRDAGREVEYRNFAVGGTVTRQATELMKGYFEEFEADLMFVAFGMNDIHESSPEVYGRDIRALVDAARAVAPELEIVLISSMPRNPKWRPQLPPGPGREYCAELENIASGDPAIAVADVNAQFELLYRRKKFLDVTGNGVNHPNDFGHRLYAATVAALLG